MHRLLLPVNDKHKRSAQPKAQRGKAVPSTTCCFCCVQVKNVEVGTNIVAAYVSGGRAHEVLAVMDALALSASDGFEIAFNQACADVATGKLEAAEQQLLLAHRLGE